MFSENFLLSYPRGQEQNTLETKGFTVKEIIKSQTLKASR